MNAAQVNLNSRSAQDIDLSVPEQMASALVDGEVDSDRLDAVFASEEARSQLFSSWHAYQVIGDALRGNAVAVAAAQPTSDFLSSFRERLHAEAEPAVRPSISLQEPLAAPPSEALVREPAANDAVFRWKLVAGFASLAAVMAVSWTVLSSVPSTGGQTGSQLAAAPAAAEAVVPVAAPSPSTAVVVNTGQGPLIRDARLEELLAEHRQNGGMSALQMPTGFIRNATYDAAGR